MSEFKNLTLEVADGIAVLAISRPAALNALNSETLHAGCHNRRVDSVV